MRLFIAACMASEATTFSRCVEIISSACGIVGGVADTQGSALGFLGAGIIHNSPWQKNTWKMPHFSFSQWVPVQSYSVITCFLKRYTHPIGTVIRI